MNSIFKDFYNIFLDSCRDLVQSFIAIRYKEGKIEIIESIFDLLGSLGAFILSGVFAAFILTIGIMTVMLISSPILYVMFWVIRSFIWLIKSIFHI